MKKFASLIVGVLVMSTMAFAQETAHAKMNPEEKAKKMTEKMSERLELDEATTAQLAPINENFVHELSRVKTNEDLTKEEKKAKMKEAKDAYSNEVKAILSEEQFAELEAWHAEKQAKRDEKKAMKDKSPEERALIHTQKITDLLDDLTPEQIEQIRQLNEKVENKIQAIRDNDEMTDEKKKEFIKGNRKDQKTVLKSILTETQWNTLKEAKKAEHK